MNRSIAILLLAGIVWSGKSADTEYERAVHDAEELLTAGRFEEVIGKLEGWTRDRERYPEAHRLFGLAFYSLQKFPVAILHLQTALRLRPGDSEMHRQMAEVLGVAHYLNGSPRDALPWLEKAAAQGPADSKLLYTLAMSQMQSGEAAKSAGTIARLYGAAAGSPQALLVTAVHLLQLGMVQDASTLLEKVAITDPTLPDLAYRRGLIALRYANYPVAQKLFEEEIQRSPAHAAAWHALGEARFASANTESAEEALQRAV